MHIGVDLGQPKRSIWQMVPSKGMIFVRPRQTARRPRLMIERAITAKLNSTTLQNKFLAAFLILQRSCGDMTACRLALARSSANIGRCCRGRRGLERNHHPRFFIDNIISG
jgi:hypothetical protein